MNDSNHLSSCRTCLVEAVELNNIFDLIEFENETLRICDMILMCIGLEIKEDDDLTKSICHTCDQEITKFYMFRKKCFESDCVLKMKKEIRKPSSEDDDDIMFHSTIDDDIYKQIDDDDNSRIYIESKFEMKPAVSSDIQLLSDSDVNVAVEPPKPADVKIKSPPDDTADDVKNSDRKLKLRLNQFPTPQKCDFCRRTFLSIRAYTSHIETHNKQIEYLCNICGQAFRTKSTHRDHMYRHANRNRCTICDHNFSSPFQLRLHMYKHTGEKPHKCEICGTSYAQLSYFKIHMRIHTGEKPYKCRFCDKSFAACNARTKHEVDHQDPSIRPFQCHICPKNFRKKENYRKHLLTHTGEKSQKCPYCEKTFLFRKGLVVHIRSHTGEKPHECEYCDKKFTQKHCLLTHVASHHKASN